MTSTHHFHATNAADERIAVIFGLFALLSVIVIGTITVQFGD